MLSFNTKDAWSTISVAFDDGGGALTWSPSAGVLSAYGAILDLVAWLDASFAGETATWGWGRADAANTFLIMTVNGYDVTAVNAAAQSVMGFDAVYPPAQTSTAGVAGMAGTWEPATPIAVRDWFVSPLFDGKPSGDGAVGHRAAAVHVVRPTLRAVMTATEASRLGEVATAAANPRSAMIYDYKGSAWRGPVAVGSLRRRRAGMRSWSVSIAGLA